ncbi:MAG: acid phosphatase [Magnetospirillum sp.]|nr:acid phosphatase [Magnetospirillum sp.]
MTTTRSLCVAAVAAAAIMGMAPAHAEDPPTRGGLDHIQHIVVIYLENRSFDNVFGLFPGADGITRAVTAAPPQVDASGYPYATLPQPRDTTARPPGPDPRFPADLPNRPFDIGRYVPLDRLTGDLVHRYYQNIAQIDGSRDDRFAEVSDAAGLTMGYYDTSGTELWRWARRFTLADHFFMGAFGGSFLNHMMLVCACAPVYQGAPDLLKARLDADGRLIADGALTPDGHAVNTIQPFYPPYAPRAADPAKRMPPIDLPTIGDRLTAKGVSWAWYAGGWADALAGKAPADFEYHHQPFAYFRAFAPGSPARAEHLKDGADFLADIAAGTLPAVAFYKPAGRFDEHPGYATITEGDRHLGHILESIERSPMWSTTAIIVTYDENGGFYDHVPPPRIDRWGPGNRVPAVIISPFAKKGQVDHTVYDTASILKFIEARFGLAPLTDRDARADGLSGAFDF